VVIDRLNVEESFKLRISQSVQQSLRMGKDLMFLLVNDENKLVQYSKQLMCEDTGLSYEEPSPNAFSFNSPYGACNNCKGLGSVFTISLEAIMPDKTKSIKEGGIAPLGEEREAYLFNLIQQIAKKNKISLDKPLQNLLPEELNLILYGKKQQEENEGDDINDIPEEENTKEFEGIIPMLKRWFASSTGSESLRSWVEKFMEQKTCPACNGARLKKESLWFKIDEKNIAELSNMNLDKLFAWFSNIEKRLNSRQQAIAKDILKEIRERLQFMLGVGLTYLSINRSSGTLSGGESQRIRLATQIGSQLQGITYILDEPSIGLHQRDNQRLISALQNLRDIGNSIIVVEHDKDIMLAADYLVDIGPKAGKHGGNIVAAGTPAEVIKSNSETAQYLSGKKSILIPSKKKKRQWKKH